MVYRKRAGGQSHYSALLAAQAQSDSDALSKLELWIAENLKSDFRVEANFPRVYAQMRGRTPAKAR